MTKNDEQLRAQSQAKEMLEALQSDVELAAAEITRGEFSESGTGNSGIAFRAIKKVPDSEMEAIWSQLISICRLLWEADHVVAAIVLVETAARQFFIPELMAERVASSIENAKNLKVMKLAEEAFEQGEDEKALRITSELPTSVRAKFSEDLKTRITRRRRTRRTAIWIGGVSVSSLLVVAVIGVFSFVELLKDPPRPTLPDFGESDRMFDDIFSDSKVTEEIEEHIEARPSPDTATPAKKGLVVEQDHPILPVQKTAPSTILPAKGTSESTPAIVETSPVTHGATPDSPVVDPIVTSKVTRENCVVGFAALQRATSLMQERPDDARAKRRVAEFMSTLQEACKDIDLDPVALSLEAGMVPAEQVDAIARGIIE
jgi:hypothetical protein